MIDALEIFAYITLEHVREPASETLYPFHCGMGPFATAAGIRIADQTGFRVTDQFFLPVADERQG
jgi:hypothetical protein